MSLLLGLLTFVLVLISLFMVLVILAQRTKSDGGVGAGLGGGVAEAAFGAESGNVLTKATTVSAVAFFVISFALYLGHIHQHRMQKPESGSMLPGAAEFAPAPAQNPSDTTGTPPTATTPTPEAATSPAPSSATPSPATTPGAETTAPAEPKP